MSFGVPFGAYIAFQAVTSKPSTPCSATDFTPGSSSLDFSVVTASAFSLPAATWPREAVAVSMISGTWPPIVSVIAVAEPLYGTPNSGAPVLRLQQLEDDARRRAGQRDVDLVGLRLGGGDQLGDRAWPGTSGLAEITIGSMPTRMTGSKSFSASKPVES